MLVSYAFVKKLLFEKKLVRAEVVVQSAQNGEFNAKTESERLLEIQQKLKLPISDWLHGLGLQELAEKFIREDFHTVEHVAIVEINDEDLKELGVEKLAQRLVLLKEIQKIALLLE